MKIIIDIFTKMIAEVPLKTWGICVCIIGFLCLFAKHTSTLDDNHQIGSFAPNTVKPKKSEYKSIKELVANRTSTNLTYWDECRLRTWDLADSLDKEYPDLKLGQLEIYDYSMKVFAIESCHDSSAKNKCSSARGIFQAMKFTRKRYNMPQDFVSLGYVEQIYWYGVYMRGFFDNTRKITIASITKPIDFYLIIFYPKLVGKSLSAKFASRGSKEYDQNNGYDLNRDGTIYKSEIEKAIMKRF